MAAETGAALQPRRRQDVGVDGVPVEVRSPAIATVAGHPFEIRENGIELLIRPPKPRTP